MTPDPQPDLIELDRDEYLDRYERFQRRPGTRRPWYERLLGRKPRGFYTTKPDSDNPDGAVVLDKSRLDARWYERLPLARLGVQGLLFHEYIAHALGHGHPPRWHPAYWLDVTGCGLRITDRHDGIPEAKAWIRSCREED